MNKVFELAWSDVEMMALRYVQLPNYLLRSLSSVFQMKIEKLQLINFKQIIIKELK